MSQIALHDLLYDFFELRLLEDVFFKLSADELLVAVASRERNVVPREPPFTTPTRALPRKPGVLLQVRKESIEIFHMLIDDALALPALPGIDGASRLPQGASGFFWTESKRGRPSSRATTTPINPRLAATK